MAKLFVSYAREDQERVEKLVHALETAGHSVWWDKHIRAGAVYHNDIEQALTQADVAIVMWSSASVQSNWVKDEAVFARDAQKLVPICIEACDAPLGFRQYQTIDFSDWTGDSQAPSMTALLTVIAEKTGATPPLASHSEPQKTANTAHQPPAAATAPRQISQLINQWRAQRPFLAAGLAIMIGLISIIGFYAFFTAPQTRDDVPAQISIAVLPFEDMSQEGNQQYFADGLSEELLNVLARVEGLTVASRTSSFAMKDQPLSIGAIAKSLKVDHLVEGSIRKSNDRIRVTAQLIDARNDRHLWSETYDRRLSDIFRIQDEIANSVLTALTGELGMTQDKKVSIAPATENLDAYDMYLRARELFLARGGANVRESLRLFEKIVAMQPDYAEAWEGLAAVYAIATSWGISDRDYSALSFDAAKKALEYDPSLSMPYAVMGLAYRTHYPTPWSESIANLNIAIEKDPQNANAYLWLGMNYMALGYHDKAMAALDQCIAIDAALKLCRKYKSITHLFREEYDAALALAEINASEGYFGDFDVYIPVLLERDDRFAAYTVSRTIYWWGDFPHKDYIHVLLNPQDATPEKYETLKAWAKKRRVKLAGRTSLNLAFHAYDLVNADTFGNDYEDLWLPAHGHFRATPQFKTLAKAMGLEAYWREYGFPAQCKIIGPKLNATNASVNANANTGANNTNAQNAQDQSESDYACL